MKPAFIFLSALLVADTFFVSYCIGFNSRHVLIVEGSDDNMIVNTVAAIKSLVPTQNTTTPVTKPQTAQTAPLVTTTQTAAVPTANPAPVPATTDPIVSISPSASFKDISDAEPRLQKSITYAMNNGVLDAAPDHAFHPNNPVTRGDFVRWMSRMRQFPQGAPDQATFADVAKTNPYFGDIEGAYAQNMIQGYSGKDSTKQFKPDNFITREEFAVMYGTFSGKRARAEKLKKEDIEKYLYYDPSTSSTGTLTYRDIGDVDDWAYRWVAVAHQAGVLDQAFNINPAAQETALRFLHPHQRMTRGEAINILTQLYGN